MTKRLHSTAEESGKMAKTEEAFKSPRGLMQRKHCGGRKEESLTPARVKCPVCILLIS